MAGDLLYLRLPTDEFTPANARGRFRRWLAGVSCPDSLAEDLLIAVSEAVTNAVEHAYADGDGDAPNPGVSLRARVAPTADRGASRIEITVSDGGRWRSARADNRYRGRGLRLMRTLTQSLDVSTTSAGTQVHMTSTTFPPDPESGRDPA